ncbi:MAG: hypothetical protein KF910_12180 [Brevundimonas sp.]|uniref:hypothetical protein n=1 Tax=Brevundimonas sp. TaxID=1871086 RepID=UPI0025BC0995|nr:hypothetical protein [Brevundimonas sp.]MBX3478362.1 hypothetical protein [Brevundimonas sp.]
MTAWRDHKIRSEETWAEVRRCWEAGETGASVARRYDVGLANLWRRRAAEGWARDRPDDPAAEPVEGWDRYAQGRLAAWEGELEAARELALDLMAALAGGPLEGATAWRLGWLYRMRAQRLGPEVAAADREAARDKPWFEAFWTDEGRLRRQGRLDQATLVLWRDDWRRQAGLPQGAAERFP